MSYKHDPQRSGITTYHQTGGSNHVHQHIESGAKVWASMTVVSVLLLFPAAVGLLCFLGLFTSYLDFLK